MNSIAIAQLLEEAADRVQAGPADDPVMKKLAEKAKKLGGDPKQAAEKVFKQSTGYDPTPEELKTLVDMVAPASPGKPTVTPKWFGNHEFPDDLDKDMFHDSLNDALQVEGMDPWDNDMKFMWDEPFLVVVGREADGNGFRGFVAECSQVVDDDPNDGDFHWETPREADPSGVSQGLEDAWFVEPRPTIKEAMQEAEKLLRDVKSRSKP